MISGARWLQREPATTTMAPPKITQACRIGSGAVAVRITTRLGPNAATSPGPCVTQLLSSGRYRVSSTPTTSANSANGRV